MISVSIFLSLSFLFSQNQSDFIEFSIFIVGPNQTVLKKPGVIFKLLPNGTFYRFHENVVVSSKLTKKKYEFFLSRIEKNKSKGIRFLPDKTHSEYYKFPNLDKYIYSRHGVISCLRIQTSNIQSFLVSTSTFKKGPLANVIMKIKKAKKNIISVNKHPDEESHSELFPIVAALYSIINEDI